MAIVGVLTAWELGYNTWFSVHLSVNDGSAAGISIWFILKLITLASFIWLLFLRESVQARRFTFITYTATQVLEIVLVTIWFLVEWYSHQYYCVSATNKCTPDGLCQSCYLLMYPIFYLVLGIPFKIWFSCITYRFWKASDTTKQVRRSLLKVNNSTTQHPYYAFEEPNVNSTRE